MLSERLLDIETSKQTVIEMNREISVLKELVRKQLFTDINSMTAVSVKGVKY